MPPLRYVGTPAQWDATTAVVNDVVTQGYVDTLLAADMTTAQVDARINADLATFMPMATAQNQMNGVGMPAGSALATPAWAKTQTADYINITTVGTAGGPVPLDAATGQIPGQYVTGASTQRWPSPFWSPTTYLTGPMQAALTDTLLYTIAIPNPGYTYVLSCFGMLEVQVSADDGTIPEVLVRQGSTNGPIIAAGYGCAENYTGATPGTMASAAFVNQNNVTFPNWSNITSWVSVNDNAHITVMNGNAITIATTMTATLSASVNFGGGSGTTSTQIRIINVGDGGTVVYTGAAITPPPFGTADTGTCTVTWTGPVTAGQTYAIQGIQTVSAGFLGVGVGVQGQWLSGSSNFTVTPAQIQNSGIANIIPVPLDGQATLTGPTTLYVMLHSSNTATQVTAGTVGSSSAPAVASKYPSLWVMPIPWNSPTALTAAALCNATASTHASVL